MTSRIESVRRILNSNHLSDHPLRKAAVIGAGTMGSSIAQVFAQAGYKVGLVDVQLDILKSALSRIRENLSLFEDEKLLASGETEQVLSRIDVDVDPSKAVYDADFVTEAVTEDIGVKKQIFKMLDELCRKDAILASNTSGLSMSEIAKATAIPGRVIGTNWWNPGHIIPLVEIMRGESTTEETVKRTRNVLSSIGKKPIVILKPIQGFIGNRLQIALFREALNLYENGVATIDDIDTAISFGPGFRYPVLGPFRISDFGGLDIFYHLCGELFAGLDNSECPSGNFKRLVESNKIGLKSGAGFYDYTGFSEVDLVKDRDRRLLKIHRAILEGQ